MEKARKRIRICLTCIVLAAIGIGLFYYYYEIKGNGTANTGTLISNVEMGIKNYGSDEGYRLYQE